MSSISSLSPHSFHWRCARGHVISLGRRTVLMGILNVTPDSFSDGGRFLDSVKAIDQAQALVEQGADVIDIGAESTRPGAQEVDEQEEIRRLKPVIQSLGKSLSIPISVDTRKASVARMALDLGAVIVNDVSALQFDPRMKSVVAEFQAGVVLMHMKGNPLTMQDHCHYGQLVQDVKTFLRNRLLQAERDGIPQDHIVLDPGIGFAKTAKHNLSLIAQLRLLEDLGRPIIIGVSNKSFIGVVTGRDVNHRLMGTAAAVTMAVLNGAHIVRVHEVEAMRDVVRMAETFRDLIADTSGGNHG